MTPELFATHKAFEIGKKLKNLEYLYFADNKFMLKYRRFYLIILKI